MDTDPTHTKTLRIDASRLLARLQRQRQAIAAEVAGLDLLLNDARAHAHRRAQHNARDRNCSRLGAAFEPFDGLDLDDIAMVGSLARGHTAVLLLAQAALAQPNASLIELLRSVFRAQHGPVLRACGIYCRWTWLANLYHRETEAFLRSLKGRDPKARWRSGKPTTNQRYLSAQIAHLLQIVTPCFADRGAAFDWIKAQGGNPRFRQPPPTVQPSGPEGMSR